DSEGFHTKATATIGIMRLNREREALTNNHIRDALYNAFSRKKLTKFILKDGSEPAFYFVPKNFAKGPEGKDFRVKYPTINKMSDKEMMAAWKKGLEEIGKDSLTFELMIRNNSTTEKVGTFVASQLEKNLPGLTININKQPSGQFLKLEKGQQYDISLSYWIPDYKDPMTYLGMWVTGNSANRSGYSNSKYDALIQKAKHLGQKPKKRWEIMQKAEKVLLEDVGFIPVYQYGKIYVQKPYVKHITQRMLSDIDWTRAKVLKH
ncbi:MAG TPA: ABC transporter substrate-binding protein, partial [Bacillales bacterium]